MNGSPMLRSATGAVNPIRARWLGATENGRAIRGACMSRR